MRKDDLPQQGWIIVSESVCLRRTISLNEKITSLVQFFHKRIHGAAKVNLKCCFCYVIMHTARDYLSNNMHYFFNMHYI